MAWGGFFSPKPGEDNSRDDRHDSSNLFQIQRSWEDRCCLRGVKDGYALYATSRPHRVSPVARLPLRVYELH